MTFDELVDFLEHRMRMSHIYQPLLIRSLVDVGGVATLRQLASLFLAQDESQLLHYEKRIREMPVRVLSGHGILQRDGELVRLTVAHLTLEQKSIVRMLCEQKMQEYVQKRGLSLWDYRLLEADPVPDSLRYQVLKESKGRCALCGATKDERPLDVDHIVPRARGGRNELANLQVLCSKCNRSKRDADATDFRSGATDEPDPGCPFCSPVTQADAVATNGTVIAIEDRFPVTPMHTLVLPRRHVPDYFQLSGLERQNADELVRYLRRDILGKDPTVTGFNVGVNSGVTAGQTVMHCHIHLIPRRPGDTPEPRGGVRGVVPERMSY